MIRVKTKTTNDCDVLIAGGGPAGSGLAFHLAKMGYKVIVVEASEFPRDKVCGDGVSPIAMAELDRMGITKTRNFKKANEITEVGLFIKNDKVVIPLSKPEHLPFHARIIPRLQLDNLIYIAAKKAGAVYIQNTRVTGYTITDNAVSVNLLNEKKLSSINAKMIVGADGSSSLIARLLSGQNHDDAFQLLGLRSYFEYVNGPNNRVDIFFTEDSFPGIFWLFPAGATGANIGMAMVSKTMPAKPTHVRELLQKHIDTDEQIKERIGNGKMNGKIQGWPIRFFNSKSKITGHRVLLIGDAAGLINPLSGDGIQYALLSSRWASETIDTCLQQNDFSEAALYNFRKKVDQELGYDFALSNLLVQFPRNKTFSKLWISILEIIIAQAKEDKTYADTIAGIFEGTYPSYKALNLPFILKSIKQGGNELAGNLLNFISHPESNMEKAAQFSASMANLVSELNIYKQDHISWLKSTAGKTFFLAGQMLKHVLEKRRV